MVVYIVESLGGEARISRFPTPPGWNRRELQLATALKESIQKFSKVVNDRSRKVILRGKTAIVPLKFDEDGEPAAVDRLILKRLSLNDLRFLGIWRNANWDIAKAVKESGIEEAKAERLIKKLACFREEDAKIKALCEIPSPSWIKSKHVENFYEGGLMQDSQHKSLQELAKIEGAYKTNVNVSMTQNVFNLPKLTPEIESEFKALAEKALEAEEVHDDA